MQGHRSRARHGRGGASASARRIEVQTGVRVRSRGVVVMRYRPVSNVDDTEDVRTDADGAHDLGSDRDSRLDVQWRIACATDAGLGTTERACCSVFAPPLSLLCVACQVVTARSENSLQLWAVQSLWRLWDAILGTGS